MSPQDSIHEAAAVVLAAGKGTRMKSELPKVAAPLAGRSMLNHVLDRLVEAGIRRIVLIVGYKKEEVIALVPEVPGVTFEYAVQEEQKGTAHALLCARDTLGSFHGPLLVACGDMPLIRSSTVRNLVNTHINSAASATVLSAVLDNPKGYGRIVRDTEGRLEKIVEEKDASDEIRTIQETNTGTYVFNSPEIFSILTRIDSNNAQNEYYLPDAIALLRSGNSTVAALALEDPVEAMGANSREDLLILEEKYHEYRSKGE